MSTIDASSQAETDIHCPLCDYNLRGLTEPRCPECGHRFDWDELRDAATNKHPYLFEHQRGGWRAFVATWWRSLRSRKFWNSLHTTHPINRWRLLAYWFLMTGLASLLLLAPIPVGLVRSLYDVRVSRRAWIAWVTSRGTPQDLATLNATYGNLQNAAAANYPYYSWNSLQQVWSKQGIFRCSAIAAMAVILLWPPLTFATLMIYRRVLQQAEVRKLHVMRAVIYSAAPLLLLGPLMSLIWLDANSDMFFYVALGLLPNSAVLILGLLMLLLGWRIVVACESYLRLPLLVPGAVLTQILVVLTLVKLYMVLVIGWW